MSTTLNIRTALFALAIAMSIALLGPPGAQALTPPEPQTTITFGPSSDHVTTDRTPTFGFTSNIAGSTFACSLDGAAFVPCTSPYTSAQLADGSHTFDVRATAAAVNDSTPARRSFFVDYQFIPDTEITSGPGHGTVTSDPTPTFGFQATSVHAGWGYPQHGSTSFACSIDAGAWFACSSPYTTPTLADGLHTFAVRATHNGHTDGTPASRTFRVDRGVPDTSITGGPTEGSVTSDATPTFSFVSDRGDATFTCSVDGQTPGSCSSPATLGALADGTHTFAVAATSGGQTDPSPALRTFVIDAPDQPGAAAGTPPGAAAAGPVLAASTVSIRSVAARIGATGATKVVLRCSAGSGECTGRLHLVKTIRFRCGTRFCYLRKTFGKVPFMVPSGSRLALTLQLTPEAIRLVRRTALDRMLVVAVAKTDANRATRTVMLIGRRPA